MAMCSQLSKRWSRRPGRGSEAGFGLMGVFLLVMLVAAIGVYAMGRIARRTGTVAVVNIAQDRQAFRQMLLNAVDCRASFGPGTCAGAGKFQTLLRKRGNADVPLVQRLGTRFGRWTLRAECDQAKDGFVVRMAHEVRASTGPSFPPDPMTGLVYDWKSPAGIIFSDADPLCPPPNMDWSKGDVAATTCIGANHSGLCAGGYSLQVTFKTSFAQPPNVIVAMATPIAGAGVCSSNRDRDLAYATNVTTTGFTMICASSPSDPDCATNPYAGSYYPSSCTWAAFER